MNARKVMKKGFTLIEVVIVLAIAALIMVVVFLAVTGAQRAQRDQARKDYANAGLAKLNEFNGNNGGTSEAINDITTGPGIFAGYMGNRTINGIAPDITIGAPATNEICNQTGAGENRIQIQGAAAATGEQVAACLESNIWYVARAAN